MTGAAAFRWHPAARLFGADPAPLQRLREPAGQPVLADAPAAVALARALSRAERGLAFRIGAPAAPPPEPGPQPGFETLTSGSTGTPRRIRRSQASWIGSFAVNAGLFGIGPGLGVATLGGLTQSLSLYGALEGMHLGAEVHLLAGLRPDRQRAALAGRAVALLYATPAQLRALADAPGPALPLTRILCGGSKLDPALRALLRALAPEAEVCEFYGAAEASFITLAGPDSPPDSVGRPYPGVELRLGTPDRPADPGRPAELWVRSPYLFEGYGDGCAEGAAGSARWQDGWLSVGEHGRLRDGALVLSGRAGRMVTVADQNVFPEEIEALMQGMPGIERVAVVPVPDERRGQVLVALVQGDRRAEGAVTAALRARLGALKSPKALIWIEDWPVLQSGKTDLRALEARLKWPG
jgi:long-chain acyl-CoA synthetase